MLKKEEDSVVDEKEGKFKGLWNMGEGWKLLLNNKNNSSTLTWKPLFI